MNKKSIAREVNILSCIIVIATVLYSLVFYFKAPHYLYMLMFRHNLKYFSVLQYAVLVLYPFISISSWAKRTLEEK